MLLATLARLAFPSWAFFDRIGTRATLELRPAGSAAWRPAFTAAPRRWWHVVWHPEGTRTLLAQGVVERVVAEHAGERPATAATAAQLDRLLAACAAGDVRPCAWRIVVAEPDGAHAVLRDGVVPDGAA